MRTKITEYSTLDLDAMLIKNILLPHSPIIIDALIKKLKYATCTRPDRSIVSAIPYILYFICQYHGDEKQNEVKRDIFTGLMLMTHLQETIHAKRLIQTICERGDFLSNADLFFILKDVDVKAKDSKGQTLLHHACSFGNLKVAEILLRNGADINAVDNHGNTPLSISVRFGEIETFEFLVKSDADIHTTYENNQTLLHIIAASPMLGIVDRNDVVNLLVEREIDINAQDRYGRTALHLAAQRNNIELVNIICSSLLTKDSYPPFADPFIRDDDEKTARNYASGDLVKKVLKDAENIKLTTALLSPLIPRLRKKGTLIRILPEDLIREVAKEVTREQPNPTISAAFHVQLAGQVNHGQENEF